MYMAIVKQYIAFENACKDQIDMACTKEGLMPTLCKHHGWLASLFGNMHCSESKCCIKEYVLLNKEGEFIWIM